MIAKYLENLPSVSEYDKAMILAHQELFSFLIDLQKKYALTPTQELLILHQAAHFLLEQCAATEKKKSKPNV